MSDALINKYRPQTFAAVVGQDKVVRSLENALEKKLGDAFLFVGGSGMGKTTLSRLAALKLGCAPGGLIEIDAATNTGIDDMRAVTADLFYKPLDGPVKALIVDECQALSKAAWQSLLKILEEPPPWAYWFLCTTDPAKVPEAAKTRCLTYQLAPVAPRVLFDLICGASESKDVPDDVLDLCAREAGGSPRQALANLGVCLTAKTREEAADLLQSVSESPEAVDLARALVKGVDWPAAQVLLSKLPTSNPESVRHVVRAYCTKVVLGAKSPAAAENGLAILDAFSTPFHSSDGVSPLVLACGRLLLNGGEKEPF
jgi:DNA polymerase-3 subunit gamma/tau